MELTEDEKQILYKLVKQEQAEHLKSRDNIFKTLLQTNSTADEILAYTSSTMNYEQKLDALAYKLQ